MRFLLHFRPVLNWEPEHPPMATSTYYMQACRKLYALYRGIAAGGLKYTFKDFLGISTGFRYGTPDKEIPSFKCRIGCCRGGLKVTTWLYGFYKGLLTNSFSVGLGWVF